MPTPPGFADCSLEFQQTGLTRPAYITFGVNPTDTDPSVVAGLVHAAWGAAGSLRTIMDSSVTMTGVRASLGTDGSGDLVYVMATTDLGTGSALTALPANCAVLVHKTTDRGGRRGRGRMYIPWCLAESACDEAGIITAGNLSTIQTALNGFKAALVTQNVPMVLLHSEGKTAIVPPDPVNFLIADRLIATQRRRLGR